jgi:hypothetical protein
MFSTVYPEISPVRLQSVIEVFSEAMTEKRGRPPVLDLAERQQCAAMIRDLLSGKRNEVTGRKWVLRTLADELGVSTEAVRKAKDPKGVGEKIARGLRAKFGMAISLDADSPIETLHGLSRRLTELGVERPLGVALNMALNGDLKEGLSEAWKVRLKTVVDALIEEGVPEAQAYGALGSSLEDVHVLSDSLTLYRRAMRLVNDNKN